MLLSTPKVAKGFPSRTQNLMNYSNYNMLNNGHIKSPKHGSDPTRTKSKFYVKVLKFLKSKGEEEEGQCREFGGKI